MNDGALKLIGSDPIIIPVSQQAPYIAFQRHTLTRFFSLKAVGEIITRIWKESTSITAKEEDSPSP
jgi:hypothetical protein